MPSIKFEKGTLKVPAESVDAKIASAFSERRDNQKPDDEVMVELTVNGETKGTLVFWGGGVVGGSQHDYISIYYKDGSVQQYKLINPYKEEK